MAFKFAEKTLPSWFKTIKINNSLLPSISQNTVKMNGRRGLVDFGNEIGERKITVEYKIIADDMEDLKVKIREMNGFFYSEITQRFIMLDEPDKYYLAKITGESDLDETLHIGHGELEFICTDPHCYSIEETTENLTFTGANQKTYINVGGGTMVEPRFSMEFTRAVSNFKLMGDNEYLEFGVPREVESVPVDSEPLIFADAMGTATGWLTANSVDDGVISGSFVSNGYSLRVDDYGQAAGSSWYGPAAVKSLGGQFQDFKFDIECGIHLGSIGELGRIEVYFLDVNNVQLGKISIRNGNPDGITPYAEAKLGQSYIYQGYGLFPGVWRNWASGNMAVARRGNEWSFYWAMHDAGGNDVARFNQTFVDANGLHMQKVSKIQIHLGRHTYEGSSPVSNMYISDIKAYDLSPGIVPQNTHIPYCFRAGDVLRISNATGEISINGKPNFTFLKNNSKYIKFLRGLNGIAINYDGSGVPVANAKTIYRKRWL